MRETQQHKSVAKRSRNGTEPVVEVLQISGGATAELQLHDGMVWLRPLSKQSCILFTLYRQCQTVSSGKQTGFQFPPNYMNLLFVTKLTDAQTHFSGLR